jgi:hypothetical protein
MNSRKKQITLFRPASVPLAGENYHCRKQLHDAACLTISTIGGWRATVAARSASRHEYVA